jgi:hypothetical protein
MDDDAMRGALARLGGGGPRAGSRAAGAGARAAEAPGERRAHD